jgi:hypothetical protein
MKSSFDNYDFGIIINHSYKYSRVSSLASNFSWSSLPENCPSAENSQRISISQRRKVSIPHLKTFQKNVQKFPNKKKPKFKKSHVQSLISARINTKSPKSNKVDHKYTPNLGSDSRTSKTKTLVKPQRITKTQSLIISQPSPMKNEISKHKRENILTKSFSKEFCKSTSDVQTLIFDPNLPLCDMNIPDFLKVLEIVGYP